MQIVEGCKINWANNRCPYQIKCPKEIVFSENEKLFIDTEIERLLKLKVIAQSTNESGEFISTIFVRPKQDGSFRLILNLKILNNYIEYHHFKMETLQSAINMMTEGCYMACIDLKDAYYSVPIHNDFQKYLKFLWRNTLYKFTCLPNGLACAPRLFTKLMKPVFSTLRLSGLLSVAYIDDIYLQGDTLENCKTNVITTVEMLRKLGLVFCPPNKVSI